jgi:nitrite reductase/ring-hydroxylating ferredoxin subunit
MLGRLRALFGGKPALIKGAARLQDGMAKKIVFGDPIAGDGVEVILCRVDGALQALDALCPHEGGRIAEGPLAGGKYAVCPLHSYQFDPATGECENATCRKAKTYRVRESGEDCEIWL